MSDIKKEVVDLAAVLKKEIKVDNKTGIATITDGIYEKNLPDGLTKTAIEQLQAYNTRMAAAATLAVGEIGCDTFKKHKDLDSIDLEVPLIGKDRLNISFDRSRQVPLRGENGVTGTQTKYGSASVSYDMYGTGPRGELKKVKQYLAEQALAAFGSK